MKNELPAQDSEDPSARSSTVVTIRQISLTMACENLPNILASTDVASGQKLPIEHYVFTGSSLKLRMARHELKSETELKLNDIQLLEYRRGLTFQMILFIKLTVFRSIRSS